MSVLDIVGLLMVFSLATIGIAMYITNVVDHKFITNHMENISKNLERFGIVIVVVGTKYRLISEQHNRYTDYMYPSDAKSFLDLLCRSDDLVSVFCSDEHTSIINITDTIDLFGEIKPIKKAKKSKTKAV